MTGKEQFKKLSKTMKYMWKDGKWYQLIYFDANKKRCVYKPISKEMEFRNNTKTYEEVISQYIVEFKEKTMTPDEFFMKKISDKKTNMLRNVTDERLISYINSNKNECQEAIFALIQIAITDNKKTIRKAALDTCKKIGINGRTIRIYRNLLKRKEK